MIKIISLNPAIDKHLKIDEFNYAHLNNVTGSSNIAGGKGMNVAQIINSLKGDCILFTLLGGRNGDIIKYFCDTNKIKLKFVSVKNETRENIKIAETDGTLTELNVLGQPISKTELEKLEKLILNDAKKNDIFIITGSLPTSVDATFYKNLIHQLTILNIPVLLDTSGDALMKSISAKPIFIKPNLYELEKLFLGQKFTTITEISEAAKSLTKFGIQHILVSMGEMGSLLISDKKMYYGDALSLKVKKVVGAGDAMVAAFAMGLEKKISTEEIYKNCIAFASAWIETEIYSTIEEKSVKKLLKKVTIKKFMNVRLNT